MMRVRQQTPELAAEWQDGAEVVVIGGGVLGCSIAYHLCRAGIRDVLVVERNELASGATARSAGLLSHARSTGEVIAMIRRTRAAIAELEDLLGDSVDFRQVGTIRAAHSAESEAEMRASEACMAANGLAVERIDAPMAASLVPWLVLTDARRIIHVPDDGYLDGARLGMAYASAARKLGGRIRRGVTARDILLDDDRVCGVSSDHGAIRAAHVVDAAGAWGAEIASWLGWPYPATATRSHYWITRPDGSGADSQPSVQLPELRTYIRNEVGGLLVGLQEPTSRTYQSSALPPDMDAVPLYDDTEDLDLLVEHAAILRPVIPTVDDWRFAHHIAGLSMYTPDGRFVLGKVAGLAGFLVAGGCCGSGVSASGGIGELIAELIAGRRGNLAIFSPDRFGTVDPRSQEFHDRCRAARAGKSRGRPDPVAYPA